MRCLRAPIGLFKSSSWRQGAKPSCWEQWERERKREDRLFPSPRHFSRAASHTCPSSSTGRPFAGPFASVPLESALDLSSACVSFHHPVDPFYRGEASGIFLFLSLSHLRRSFAHAWFPGPALRCPSLYSCVALLGGNRPIFFFSFFCFLIGRNHRQVHP